MPTVATNGIQMYYEEAGEGEPLLCLMGITAPGSVWELHVEAWSKDFRCIMPDNRGVGQSDKPAGPYTSRMMADDTAGLLAALGLERVRVIGCSMGSIIAQQLALHHPDAVRSMVLMCPWARCDRYATGVFEHMKHAKAALSPAEFMNFIQLLIFAKPHWDDDAAFADLMQTQSDVAADPAPQPLAALGAQAEACIRHDVLAELPRIACPTLVIGGARDIFTPPWMGEEIAAAIPGAARHLYPDAGHAFHWECIDDFNPRIAAWFQQH
jgi:pimeloyl-ACP methyl ester carboxylesterase